MDQEVELAIVRRAYAKQILAMAGIADPPLEAAFAQVHREDFLGLGPWQMLRPLRGYAPSPDADPVHLYTDRVVGILPERSINNGQPSLHAILLAAAGIHEGDHAVHVGAGTGYYSAIMAALVGSTGRVTAVECDRELASRARGCLSSLPNVHVVHGDGVTAIYEAADVIYVNAGVTHPADAWLDGLADGGRLLIPLTTDENFPSDKTPALDLSRMMRTGVYFRIRRCGDTYEARCLCPVVMIPAKSTRNETAEAALAAAFAKGGMQAVTPLVRGVAIPDEMCWLRGDGWCLAID